MSPDKLPFLSHKHILLMLNTEEGTRSLALSALPFLKEHLSDAYLLDFKSFVTINSEMPSIEYLMTVIRASHERMHSLKDVYDKTSYFFIEPNFYVPALIDFRTGYSPSMFGNHSSGTLLTFPRRNSYQSGRQDQCHQRMEFPEYISGYERSLEGIETAPTSDNAAFAIRLGGHGVGCGCANDH